MRNFLIIESGSTKSDWAFVDDNGTQLHSYTGINPITGIGLDQAMPDLFIDKLKGVNEIFFYGAGANVEKANNLLGQYFRPFISKDTTLTIESDMLAATRACAGYNKGIVCILGTGSNSCVYDGKNIVQQIPSLGYLMSDEGSGNHIGKEILKAYFYGSMSHDDAQIFDAKYQLDRANLLAEIYNGTKVSAYLASFAPFLLESSNQLKTNILNKVFNSFIEVRIKKYTNFSNFDIYFAGSIASVFETELKAALNQHELDIKQIVKNPIQNLILYHKSREE